MYENTLDGPYNSQYPLVAVNKNPLDHPLKNLWTISSRSSISILRPDKSALAVSLYIAEE